MNGSATSLVTVTTTTTSTTRGPSSRQVRALVEYELNGASLIPNLKWEIRGEGAQETTLITCQAVTFLFGINEDGNFAELSVRPVGGWLRGAVVRIAFTFGDASTPGRRTVYSLAHDESTK